MCSGCHAESAAQQDPELEEVCPSAVRQIEEAVERVAMQPNEDE